MSDQVFTLAPYSQKGTRDQRNATDGIFGQSGGLLTLELSGDPNTGFETVFDIGVQTS